MREYRVPTGHGQAELMEKRSRFIGQVWSVTTEEAAQAQLKAVREQYADANHNVYAYRIRDGNIDRCSDAGEPQGTAGQPALGVFVKEDVTDVLCVVTRYFGGTL
ncbi:MAG: YigZ family protein, partial [Oscillospiraceae bacterium]|nr:YigZ family protein [Oscillospiraceae bacterium]